MADVLFVAIVVAFFLLCVGYVRVCDRIIGPDPTPSPDAAPLDESQTRREAVTV